MIDFKAQEVTEESPIYAALRKYESALLWKWGVTPHLVLAGDGEGVAPPERTFVVNTIIGHRSRGTPITSYSPRNDQATVKQLLEVTVQVDVFHEEREAARFMAETLHSVAFTPLASSLFQSFGVEILHASDVRNLTADAGEGRPLYHWVLEITLSYWNLTTLGQDFFNSLDYDVANVEIHLLNKGV